MAVIQEISLDVLHLTQFVSIRIQQGDNTDRKIDVLITENNEPYIIPATAQVILRMLKKDGKPIFNTCSKLGENKVQFTITPEMSVLDGRCPAQIQINDSGSGGELKTIKFHMLIDEGVYDDSLIVSTGEFTALQDALTRVGDVSNIITNAEEATADAIEATTNANNATTSANTSADNANLATTNAIEATNLANTAATTANTSATNADIATGNANQAISSMNNLNQTVTSQEDERQDFYDAYKVCEPYNNSKQYVVANKVVYGGSTYQCILDSNGVVPTNPTNWLQVASKGADGTGGDMMATVFDPTGKADDAFNATNHSYSNATSNLSSTTTQSAIDELDSIIGDKSLLTTESNTDLVGAINKNTSHLTQVLQYNTLRYTEAIDIKAPSIVAPYLAKCYFIGKWFYKLINGVSSMVTINQGSEMYCKISNTTAVNISFKNISSADHEPYVAVSVDGGAFTRYKITTDYVIALSGLSLGEHLIRIVASGIYEGDSIWTSGQGLAFQYIDVNSGGVAKSVKPTNRLGLFMGDSTAAGVNVLGVGGIPINNAGEQAFPHVCCNLLNSVALCNAFGGEGVTHMGGGGVPVAINTVDYACNGFSLIMDTPDFIVINHGHNDLEADSATFKTAYDALLKKLKIKYPATPIFCMAPFSGTHSSDVEVISDNNNCYFVDTAGWGISTSDGLHPDTAGNITAGNKLSKFIINCLGNAYFNNIGESNNQIINKLYQNIAYNTSTVAAGNYATGSVKFYKNEYEKKMLINIATNQTLPASADYPILLAPSSDYIPIEDVNKIVSTSLGNHVLLKFKTDRCLYIYPYVQLSSGETIIDDMFWF